MNRKNAFFEEAKGRDWRVALRGGSICALYIFENLTPAEAGAFGPPLRKRSRPRRSDGWKGRLAGFQSRAPVPREG